MRRSMPGLGGASGSSGVRMDEIFPLSLPRGSAFSHLVYVDEKSHQGNYAV